MAGRPCLPLGAVAWFAILCRPSSTVLLPRAHVPVEDAAFYVGRDDIVMFPISYSVPKELVVPRVPEKTAFAVNDSTRSWQSKNYQFGPHEEDAYHRNMQRHRFADTRKKGGFDCLRHYEILANGCIPVVHDLEGIPSSVMTMLPRPLLWRARELFALPWTGTEDGPGECPAAGPGAYELLAEELRSHTARHLTTEATARYLLDTLDIPVEGSKVLFLPCSPVDNFPSYLTASVFHGLVSLLGDRVIDAPEYHYAYKFPTWEDRESQANLRHRIWGQGYTLGFKLDRRPHLNRENISQRIREREFDLIIFARMSPYEPCNFWYDFAGNGASVPQFFEDIYGRYPRERIALLYGDDSGTDDAVVRTHLARMAAMHRGIGMAFVREMLPFAAEGATEVLRPVDTRLLQPGCFYPEWRDFLERWLRPGGALRDCAAWGHCWLPEVQEYLDSPWFLLQQPPEDTVALKHFCSSGFLLKAALLAQHHGPADCMADATCSDTCSFSLRSYSRGILRLPPGLFHAEFGAEPAEVVYSMSQGCMNGAAALQPAVAEQHRDIAIVAPGNVELTGVGPLADQLQLKYLIGQGFRVLMFSNFSEQALEPFRYPEAMGRFLRQPLLTEPCGWTAVVKQPLHYVHIELYGSDPDGTTAAVGCLDRLRGLRPGYLSLQLPLVAPSTSWKLAAEALGRLQASGYRRFKASRLAPAGIGTPVGPLSADSQTGHAWRTAAEVLASGGIVSAAQLHAAL